MKKHYISHINIVSQEPGVTEDRQHATPAHRLETIAVYVIQAMNPTHASVKFRKKLPKAAPPGSYLVASKHPPVDFPLEQVKEVL